jgi:FAD/FMN-containing dehydrogenase
METFQSWGRYPKATHKTVNLDWASRLPDLKSLPGSLLPYGYGRTYGDSCLNDNGTLLLGRGLNRFISFDPSTGLLACEAGVRFDEILKIFVPRGWFLPTTPGTKFVSVGGAIANDVHGKNHHADGTFGRHVTRLELVRSDGSRMLCSREQNPQWFRATMGGLGLTGLITWAEFRLAPIQSSLIESENIKTRDLEEFFDLSEASEKDWPFIVSWVDVTAKGPKLGRSLFNRGRWAASAKGGLKPSPDPLLRLPFDMPGLAINPLTIGLFNKFYYAKQFRRVARSLAHFEPFFYPLDGILDWNRGYGKRGFLQWQCLVPWNQGRQAIREILETVASSGKGSPISVLKTCGGMAGEGDLSFMSQRGLTLAMDFPMDGPRTLDLLEKLDAIVRTAGGAVYPGKDARMSAESFKAFFPKWQEFTKFIDPKFSSSFGRRVGLVAKEGI